MREQGTYPTNIDWAKLNDTAANNGLGSECMTVATVTDPYKSTLSTGTNTFSVSGSINYTGSGTVQYVYARSAPTAYTLDVSGETKLFPFTNPN